MSKVKVGVAGYGVIGMRLADGVARQEDMELVGVADVAPTLPIRALAERGMPYRVFAAAPDATARLESAGVAVSGSFDDLMPHVAATGLLVHTPASSTSTTSVLSARAAARSSGSSVECACRCSTRWSAPPAGDRSEQTLIRPRKATNERA